MRTMFLFLRENLITLLGMVLGLIAGYFYWYYYGIYDGTFGFSYFEYSDDFQIFNQNLQKEIDEVQNSIGLRIRNEELPPNHIRHSTMPWTNFTGLLHPTDFDPKESIPKIVFGKFSEKNGRKMLPISVEGHHGLMDGFHLAQYLEEFQNQLNLK